VTGVLVPEVKGRISELFWGGVVRAACYSIMTFME
jgi:hypothetical protein